MPSLDPDATVPDASIASVPLRRIRAVEPREEFLYELKAGPAGGLRPPSGPAAPRRPPRGPPGVRCCCSVPCKEDATPASIHHIDWAALGANLGSTLLFTLLLLSPLLWGAPPWHWLLAVAIALVLGLYLYVRRERYEEPGPDADETRFPR